MSRHLLDTTTIPDPWNPCAGDVYQVPNALGWDRVVVTRLRPTLPTEGVVSWIDSRRPHEAQTSSPTGFRQYLVCCNMEPCGRIRVPTETTHARA